MLNLAKESSKRGYSLGRPLAGEVFSATGYARVYLLFTKMTL